MGVKRVCVPNRSSKSPERRREQKKRRTSVEFARLRLHRYAISRKNRRESGLVGDRLMVAGQGPSPGDADHPPCPPIRWATTWFASHAALGWNQIQT
jgi:hypothetical protein